MKKRELPKKRVGQKPTRFIPSGSTLLNLAMSNKAKGGYAVGKIVNVIGDSSSGKTFLCLTAFAEMARNPRWDNYRLIFDDAEAAMEFDMDALFGNTASRLEPPNKTEDGEPKPSRTIEDFYGNVVRAVQEEKPFVYILDSFDALSSKEGQDRKEKFASGEEVGGSYKLDKQKAASEMLCNIADDIKNTKSLIIVISQTRDNISPMSFATKTRSGGRALKFYSTHEMWLAVGKTLKKKVRGKDRTIGVNTVVKLTKNKVTGKHTIIDFPILYTYGVDDTTSCIEYLVSEGHWKKKGGKIVAEEFSQEGQMKTLVKWIEDNNKESELQDIVESVWMEIEGLIKETGRKSKF